MLELGNRLKNLRVQKGLTQEQLALRLGVTKSIISAYEAGSRFPSLDMLVKLAQSYNVSTDFILGINKKFLIDASELSEAQVMLIHNIIREFLGKN